MRDYTSIHLNLWLFMGVSILIEQACLKYTRYGYRRVTPVVKKKHKAGKDRVYLLMKDMDLQVRKRRRKLRTTQSGGTSGYLNLLKGLDISYPDHV